MDSPGEITHSPAQVALLSFYRLIPLALVGPFSGVVADKVPRKTILILVVLINVAVAGALAALIQSGKIEMWQIRILAVISGAALSLELPSRAAAIRDIVGGKQVVNALSLDQMGLTVAGIIGPIVGGALIEGPGQGWAYIAIAFIVASAMVPLAGLQVPRAPLRRSSGIFPDLLAGLRYSLKSPVIRGILIITVIWNIFVFPYQSLFPVFAKNVLEVGPTLLGLMSTIQGVGMLLGSLLLASVATRPRSSRVFVVGAAIFGLGVLLFAVSSIYPLTLAILLFVGLGQSAYFVFQISLILMASSDEMRGRAMGILNLCIGASPLGLLIVAALTGRLSASTTIAIGTATALILLFLLWARMSALIGINSQAGLVSPLGIKSGDKDV